MIVVEYVDGHGETVEEEYEELDGNFWVHLARLIDGSNRLAGTQIIIFDTEE